LSALDSGVLPDWAADVVDWSRPLADDDERMALAIELAARNVEAGTGGPFGSIVVDSEDGRLLGVGVNRVVPLGNSLLHAEVVAVMGAQGRVGSFTLADRPRELHASCAPCAMCLGATHWSGVVRLVCGATREDAESLGFDEGPVFDESYRYLERHGIEVVHGIRREEAADVMQTYLDRGGPIYNP
jgi:tRNA(Arg) A34 adenosine deaminase TadA